MLRSPIAFHERPRPIGLPPGGPAVESETHIEDREGSGATIRISAAMAPAPFEAGAAPEAGLPRFPDIGKYSVTEFL